MKTAKTLAILFGGLIIAMLAGVSCAEEQQPVTENKVPAKTVHNQQTLVKRGEYLVNAVGCDDCHSPKIMTEHGPEPDPALRLSGHPANLPVPIADIKMLGPDKWSAFFNDHFTAAFGPWGVSFAANLTSDDTGIGLWTEEQFIRAIREGKFKGMENSRPLLPPMPWPMYRNFSDEDIKAIFAYLKTIKAVRNIVPAPIGPDALASTYAPHSQPANKKQTGN